MKKILFAFFLTALMPPTEPSAGVLDDSGAFVIAKAVKLSKVDGSETKEAFSERNVQNMAPETRQRTCSHPSGKKVNANRTCANNDACCDDEVCENSICKTLCTDGRATDTNKTRCTDTGTTPVCQAANHQATCVCVSGDADTCPSGMQCTNGSCVGCSGNTKGLCRCPATQYAYNNTCVNCRSNNDCAASQVCANPGTTNSYCMIKMCGNGQYVSSHNCAPCATAMTGCILCDVGTKCLECQAGYTLQNNACTKTTCSAGLFLDEDGYCKTCGVGCSGCSSDGLCTSCSNGYTLSNGECEPTVCSEGTYLDLHADPPGCKTCPTGCWACETVVSTDTTASSCVGCKYGYQMQYVEATGKYTCAPLVCSGGMFIDENSCTACSIKVAHCFTCTGTYLGSNDIKVTCESCENGFTKKASGNPKMPYECVLSDCNSKIANCKSCSTDVNGSVTCLSCMDGYAVSGSGTSCTICAANTYSVNGNSCTACPVYGYAPAGSTSCILCNGDNEIINAGRTACTTCPAGKAPNGTHTACENISGFCETNSDCNSASEVRYKCFNNKCVLRTCAEIGQAKGSTYGTQSLSCGSGFEKKTNTFTGSDGACYECAKRADYCAAADDCKSGGVVDVTKKCVNNACVLRTCGEIGQAKGEIYGLNSMTCLNTGYELSATSYKGSDSGNAYCYKCAKKSTYCDDTSGCAADKKCVNHACVAKTCADYGYISTPSSCTNGLYANSAGVSGSDGTCYECTQCAAGTEPNAAKTACVACAAGKVNPKKGGTCTVCSEGTYTSDAKNCGTCPAGYYCTSGIKTACPSGKTSTPGSTKQSDCKNCASIDATYKASASDCSGYGSAVNTEIGICYACHPCSDINVGTATSTGTCTSCTKAGVCSAVTCSTGYVATEGGGKYCAACPPYGICSNGSFTGCQSGYFKYGTTCSRCTITGCTTCKPNVASPTCTACAAGYFLENSSCTECNKACKTCSRIDQCTECVNGNTPPFCGGTSL